MTRGFETGKICNREWLHDLEHEAAALAYMLEISRQPGRISAEEKTEIRKWAKQFQTDLNSVLNGKKS